MYTGVHILSVNLEDYFQVGPLRQVIPHRHWPRFSLRIETSTLATLDLLDAHGAKATFFTLGWLADRCPDLLKEVTARGHEVASKGYHHARYDQMPAEAFRTDLLRSRDAIERATGRAVLGYRIAEGALPTDSLEPLKILAEAGLRYDSSIRPFGVRFAARPDWRRIRTVGEDGWSIVEVPLPSVPVAGIPVPVTGGNYLRQIPRALHDRLLAAYLRSSPDPWHFYFHVWELDPEQPRISAVSSVERLRQYRNLDRMRERIAAYLGAHPFQSIAHHLALSAGPAVARPAPVILDRPRPEPAVRGRRKNVSIVVPCFNEEATLPYLAGTLASLAEENRDTLNFTYVFVDDGSRDATWEVLQRLFGSRPDCILVRHPRNRGIAAATMTGIRHAPDEIVCGIDCDCSFDPHVLPAMIPLLSDDVDMVQASPYHAEGGVVNVPAWRLVLSRTLSRIYRRVLNHKFASYTACFRVYRRSRVRDLVLENEGFLGIAEMFIRLDQSGGRIVEFPTVLESRLLGVSKMKTLSVIRAHLRMLAKLAANRLRPARAAAAPASGRSEQPPPQPLRQAGRPESWCIVGGGMLGLSLAHRLAGPGREITVLESSDRFGGLADAWQIGPYAWDRHYHVTLLSDRNLRALLADIGLEDELRWTTTKTDFYTDGRFYPLNNLIDYLRFRPLGLLDKARLAATIVYASLIRDGTRLESIPVGDWLTRLSGRRVYQRIWKPLLRAKLGAHHASASASFIWSVINRFYAARRSGLKTEMFGYVLGGYARIIEELVASLQARGVRCLAGQSVRQISAADGRIRVRSLAGEADYDRVVVTAAGPIAARLCPDLREDERARLANLSYLGVVCASALLRKKLRGRYLTYIADETLPLTGIIEMTAVVDPAEFGGNTLVYLPQYVPSDDPLFDVPDEELRRTRLAALLRMYPHLEEADVLAFRISRARNVLAVQELDYSGRVPPMRTSVPGLFVVNSAQIINGNLNVDETIALGNRAADELAAQRPSEASRDWDDVRVAAE